MPWGAVAGAVASSVVGSALAPSSGGGTSGGSSTPVYVPTNLGAVDQNFNYNKGQYEGTNQGIYNQTNPYAQQLLQGQMGNSTYNQNLVNNGVWSSQAYDQAGKGSLAGQEALLGQAQQLQGQAGQTNAAYNANFGNVQNSANTLYGLGGQSNQNYQGLMDYQKGQLGNIQQSQGNLYGAGNQVLQTSQDPQNALYNRTQQQLTDQTRAGEYARGIQSSPYGAAIESNANSNFNIDWQNQQLARQTQGLQAAQGAYGSAQGLGNSYTQNQAGLQAGQVGTYAGATGAATNQYNSALEAQQQSQMGYANAIGQQYAGASQLGSAAGQQISQAGQAQYQPQQQIYQNQQNALNNYQNSQNQYLTGLNQLQSNDLGYMNFGQGAQNLGFNQNAYNNQQTQNAIGSIAGPVGKAIGNTNWGNVFSGGGGSTGYSSGYGAGSSGNDWSDFGYTG